MLTVSNYVTAGTGFNSNLNGATSPLGFSGTAFKVAGYSINFLSAGAIIAVIFGIITIGVLSGINIIGSGLASSIPWILTITLTFILPFSVLLALGSGMILSIPYGFGDLFLGILTLMYLYGIGDRLSGRGQ